MMRRSIRFVLTVLAGMWLGQSAALAQAVITGVVRDASGAVLPGVTVEAASPVLIEKVRSATSDGGGQYRITNLRPGNYDVTFTLTGFNSVKREGVALAGTATVVVNADLKVGGVAETITVTGQTALVDVQSVATERSITRGLIDAVPTGRTIFNMAALIPGMVPSSTNGPGNDVGGSTIAGVQGVGIHGGSPNDQRQLMDGLPLSTAAGNSSQFISNMGSTQEFTIDTSGVSAEESAGGVRMNVIPREGGNQFRTTIYADGTGPGLQSANYTDDLAARGLPTPNPLKSIKSSYTFNPAGGGPIKKDVLWFYVAANQTHNLDYKAIYPNLNAGNANAWTYLPDPNGTYAVNDLLLQSLNARLTWQATPRNKVAFYSDYQSRCICPSASPTTSPEAQKWTPATPQRFVSLVYSSPVTNRLLVDAAVLNRIEHSDNNLSPLTTRDFIQVNDTATGITYRGGGEAYHTINTNNNFRLAVSLVTGAHSLKAGFQSQWATGSFDYNANPTGTDYTFAGGVPTTIIERADPRLIRSNSRDLGLFLQDRWTHERFTFSGGLRWDAYNTSFPDATLGPTPLTPTRNLSYSASDGVAWKDVTYRMGVAYDVFGNARTAVKASLNKYLVTYATSGSGQLFAQAMNPVNRIVTSTTRSWNDANKNFIPDCNLQNPAANGECGGLASTAFGQPLLNTSYDPSMISGYGQRDYNWELATSVQQQVTSRLSLDIGYYRRWYGNFKVTDNLSTAASDFTQFSITAPVDARLPGGGGYTVSGLYNVNPSAFGLTNNFITQASNYGTETWRWQGVDVTASVRAWSGLTLQGGLSTGSTLFDDCAVRAALPELTFSANSTNPFSMSPTNPYCHVETPYQPQVKGYGSYMLPKVDVQVSLGIQTVPGPMIAGNFNATNAVTQPSLGRPLAGGAANASVNLIPSGTLYGDRLNQVDMRFSKIFRFAQHGRLSANMDMFNMFNRSPVTQQNDNFSPTTKTWQTPQVILPGRLIKISGQFDF